MENASFIEDLPSKNPSFIEDPQNRHAGFPATNSHQSSNIVSWSVSGFINFLLLDFPTKTTPITCWLLPHYKASQLLADHGFPPSICLDHHGFPPSFTRLRRKCWHKGFATLWRCWRSSSTFWQLLGKKKSETSEMEWDGIKDLHTCVSIDYVGDHILGFKQSHIG